MIFASGITAILLDSSRKGGAGFWRFSPHLAALRRQQGKAMALLLVQADFLPILLMVE